MRRVEHWALDGEDDDLVRRLTAGLGEDAARVMAYLLRRREQEAVEADRATQLDVRVGTGLGRGAVIDALTTLDDRDLVVEDTVAVEGRGRPPTAWRAAAGRAATLTGAYDAHASALVEDAATGDAASDADGPDAVTVGLNWEPNALQLPLYAATNGDAFAARDLETEWVHATGSHRVIEDLAAGDVDVGVAGAGTVVTALATDAPVVPVAVLYQRAPTVLYAVRSQFGGPLESVSQLRGQRIASAVGSETWLLTRLFLANAGVLEDVEFVDTEGEESAALLAGEADVATGSFSDPEDVADPDVAVETLQIAEQFPVYGPTVVAAADLLAERPSVVGRVLAAMTEGWGTARVDPDPAARDIAAASGEAAASVRSTFEEAVDRYGGAEFVADRGWGWQRDAVWERLEFALGRDDTLPESA